jgi:hypothetical protein
MKIFFYSFILGFLSTTPVLAQSALSKELDEANVQREKEIASALQPINERYLSTLELLLPRAEQASDLETVTKIKEAMAAVSPSRKTNRSPVGKWRWLSGELTELRADGTASADTLEGKWKWMDKKTGFFDIHWNQGTVVKLKLSKDGSNISGMTLHGTQVYATRIEEKQTP